MFEKRQIVKNEIFLFIDSQILSIVFWFVTHTPPIGNFGLSGGVYIENLKLRHKLRRFLYINKTRLIVKLRMF